MSDDKMALSRIRITTDVFNVCMSHALLTDSEEVMGLLLGDTIVRVRFAGGHSPGPDPHALGLQDVAPTHATASTAAKRSASAASSSSSKECDKVALVWGVSVQKRSDKRKDRVEISAEQLHATMKEAENLSKASGRQSRVVGQSWSRHCLFMCSILASHRGTELNLLPLGVAFSGQAGTTPTPASRCCLHM